MASPSPSASMGRSKVSTSWCCSSARRSRNPPTVRLESACKSSSAGLGMTIGVVGKGVVIPSLVGGGGGGGGRRYARRYASIIMNRNTNGSHKYGGGGGGGVAVAATSSSQVSAEASAAEVSAQTHDNIDETPTSVAAGERHVDQLAQKVMSWPWSGFVAWTIVAALVLKLSPLGVCLASAFVTSRLAMGFARSFEQTTPPKMLVGNDSKGATPPAVRRRQIGVCVFFAITAIVTAVATTLSAPHVVAAVDSVTQLQTTDVDAILANANVQSEAMRRSIADKIAEKGPAVAQKLPALTVGMAKATLQLIAGFVIGFLWSFQAPRPSIAVQRLSRSRLVGWVYRETAPKIARLGNLIERSLGAQLQIAIVNTALTAAGCALLKVPYLIPLNAIVFACSFIPVAGVVLSTVPIGIVALLTAGW